MIKFQATVIYKTISFGKEVDDDDDPFLECRFFRQMITSKCDTYTSH